MAPPAGEVAGALASVSSPRGTGSGSAVLPGQEVPGARADPLPVTVPSQCLDLGEEEKYPTWKRTLTRRAREAQMKRFCKAQVTLWGSAGSPARCHPHPLHPAAGGRVLGGAGPWQALPFLLRPSRGGWRRSR